ncbi:MAG: S9 family peptidase [Sediminibacterium sp.]|nr:S9 family peptidase [Sediminibacterium sp.]
MKKTTYQWPQINAPVAPAQPVVRKLHGDPVTDNYYWMIDYFRKGPQSEQVVSYLEAENAYTDAMLKGTRNFQDALFNEMKARIKEKDETVPVFKNGYYYYTRTEEGKQYYKYCRKKGNLSAPEEILLDVDAMAEGKKYFSLSGFTVSENNELLAYGVDELSRRQYTIEIKNLITGTVYAERITGTAGDPVWASDNATLFYTANNPVSLLSEKIKKHRLNTAPADDVVVYEETDKSNYIGVEKSKNNRYIFILSQATVSSETFYIPADQPDAAFRSFQPRMKEVLYEVYALEDRFLIITNQYALNFRLMETPLDQTTADHWKEIIPHRSEVLLQGLEVFQHFIVINERKHGLASLRVRELNSGKEHYIHFEEAAYTAAFHANPEFNSNTLRYSYTSLTTPASIYDYDMCTREQQLKKRQEVLGGYSPQDYTTERIDAVAKDGTKIPISIVYRKGFEKNGKAPLLLYSYGAYGISMDVGFNSTQLSLLNRGFAFAVAHIRGGQDLGRQWYEDGKLMKKLNTFTDFICCGQHLVQQQYTSKEHLYAQGGSAGGLLIGSVLNMAPDLWHGAIAQVPFVDVINTMLDESIPLTTNEFDEWGNPKNKEAYQYMKQYSPYENTTAKAYPHLLVTTGLHDSQVQYFEPAKWVARLRALKTDRNILLLHTNMHVGHGGASGRFDYLKDIAMNYAFLFALEGIQE